MNELLTMAQQLEATAAKLRETAKVSTAETLPQNDYLTTDQAAAFLGLKKCSIYGLIKKKQIPFYKPNGATVYFLVDDLKAWISKGRHANKEEEETAAVEMLEARPKKKGRPLKGKGATA